MHEAKVLSLTAPEIIGGRGSAGAIFLSSARGLLQTVTSSRPPVCHSGECEKRSQPTGEETSREDRFQKLVRKSRIAVFSVCCIQELLTHLGTSWGFAPVCGRLVIGRARQPRHPFQPSLQGRLRVDDAPP